MVVLLHPTGAATRSITNKVHPGAWNVRKQRGAFLERGGERDPFVGGADGDVPVETAGKRDGDVSVVGMHFHVESWAGAAVSIGGGRVVLCCTFIVFTLVKKSADGGAKGDVLISRG